MSVYKYRCDKCGITWDEVSTKHQAEVERDQHRRDAHGGGAPDGDRIEGATDPGSWPSASTLIVTLVAVVLLLAYSRR
ncbi:MULTISPECIES: hypothetical protein [Streptomyces]|uniref:Uncharacterized protein n=3 Tax=Streptomyces TaxID=1883 RepID=A0A3S9PS35_STRLT|nr:hypothetical protein [Streptomyces luteoverticillatus]AZQ75186.1 hypothetical protein EKH77_32165 [Streptomyces luteoverticillatus]